LGKSVAYNFNAVIIEAFWRHYGGGNYKITDPWILLLNKDDGMVWNFLTCIQNT